MRLTAATWPKKIHCRIWSEDDGFWWSESLEVWERADFCNSPEAQKEDQNLHLAILRDTVEKDGPFYRRRAPWYLWLLWYLWPRKLKWVVKNWPRTVHCWIRPGTDYQVVESLEAHTISVSVLDLKGARRDFSQLIRMWRDEADPEVHPPAPPMRRYWLRRLQWLFWPRHLKWIERG